MAPHTNIKALCSLLLGGALALPAFALDFQSIASHGAIAYEAPNGKSKKLYVLSKSTPVEVLVEQNDWRKVRDASGDLFWVNRSVLTKQRTLQVVPLRANVYKNADLKSPILFTLEKGGVVELIESGKSGWIKIKHRDAGVGFITIESVWGL